MRAVPASRLPHWAEHDEVEKPRAIHSFARNSTETPEKKFSSLSFDPRQFRLWVVNLSPGANSISRLLAVIQDPSLATMATSSPGQWVQIKRLAHQHGLSAVLAHLCSDYLPADQRVWQRSIVAAHLASHNRLLRQLKSVVAAFDAEGIRSVALKGPVLAARYLNPPFLKVSGDLDILVDEANLQQAGRCLEKIGLKEKPRTMPWWIWRKRSHHITFEPSALLPDAAPLDLHYRFVWMNSPISEKELLDRAVLWSGINGLQVRVLNPADEAILLATHAARHVFLRLSWLYDTLMVFRKLSTEEREQVLALARNAGRITILSAANRAAVDFFHEPLLPGLPDFPNWTEFRRDASHLREINSAMSWREKWYQRILIKKLWFQLAGSPGNFFDLAEAEILMPVFLHGYSFMQKIRS